MAYKRSTYLARIYKTKEVLDLFRFVVLEIVDQQRKILIEGRLRPHIKVDGMIGLIKELLAKFHYREIVQLVGYQLFIGETEFGIDPV